jgi:two-component system, sensor histidine kinase and response regulator
MPSAPLVLLAEDHPPTAEITQEILTVFGYTVVHAHNGQVAVDQARQIHPAIVLMDVQMPELDGLAATRLLRQDPATSRIPIVCLTAFALPEQAAQCREAGADDCLTKPLDFGRLEEVLRRFAPISP